MLLMLLQRSRFKMRSITVVNFHTLRSSVSASISWRRMLIKYNLKYVNSNQTRLSKKTTEI